MDIRDPRVWDKLKDQLNESDKQNLFNVYFVDSNDPIINCRKAELHIMIGSEEDDAAALKLLENNQELLALGLKAKLLAATDDAFNLEKMYEFQFGICKKEHDFEGALHFERSKSSFFYKQGDFYQALKHEYRAEGIASYLQLSYMQNVISNGLKNIEMRLETPVDNTLSVSGNNRFQKHSLFTHYTYLLLNSNFGEIASLTIAKRFKTLAESLQAKQETRYSYSLLLQHSLSFEEDEIPYQVHLNLLRLELFGRTNDYEYTQPHKCLQNLNIIIPKLKFRLQVIRDCAKLYPLGVAMAGLDAEIPILKDNHYRDGVHYLGKVLVFPNAARRLLIQDDLENTQSLSLMTKAQRYRMNQKLRSENLSIHQLVSEALIVRAKEQLRKFS